MKRKLTKYAVIITAILLAELTHAYLQKLLKTWLSDSGIHVYIAVFISMILAVAVFYPAFNIIQQYVKYAGNLYPEGSRRIWKKTFYALTAGFIMAIILLFVGFTEVWFQVNPASGLVK